VGDLGELEEYLDAEGGNEDFLEEIEKKTLD